MIHADINSVLDQLHQEKLLPDRAQAQLVLDTMDTIQPWYVRAMVGFGAWLASLLVMAFFAGVGTIVDGGFLIVGIIMVGVARALRSGSGADFRIQASLATALSGQALVVYGSTAFAGVDWGLALLLSTLVSAIMFMLFPDRLLRVIEIIIFSSAGTVWLYAEGLNAAIPIIGPIFAIAMVLLQDHEARWIATGTTNMTQPAIYGLMLSAFGCLLLSTIYLLPELGIGDFRFYPRPWISSIMLGALLLYTGRRIWPVVFPSQVIAQLSGYVFMVAVIASAWLNPGLLLALIVMIVGTSAGNRNMTAAGTGFVILFTAMYFYGIEITLLLKSLSLVATGAVLLTARSLLLKFAQREQQHA